MTISQAKKVLGNLSNGVCDKQLQEELELAEFFKDFYFSDSRNFSDTKLLGLRKTYRKRYPEKKDKSKELLGRMV